MNQDPFRSAKRTAHLVCKNRKSAPQSYKVGQNDQGEGGRSYRAADGEDLYVNEDDARILYATNQFEFIGFETPDTNQAITPRPGAKTIQEIYDEQNAAIAEKVRLANLSDTAFTPTTQPALQPSVGASTEMPQGASNLASIPLAEIQMPTTDQAQKVVAQSLDSQDIQTITADTSPVTERDLHLAETILKMRALRNKSNGT